MSSITKNFGILIIKNNTEGLFFNFIQLFLTLLNDNSKEILVCILNALNELIRHIETNEYLPSNLLSQYSQNYYEILLSLSQRIDLYDDN